MNIADGNGRDERTNADSLLRWQAIFHGKPLRDKMKNWEDNATSVELTQGIYQ